MVTHAGLKGAAESIGSIGCLVAILLSLVLSAWVVIGDALRASDPQGLVASAIAAAMAMLFLYGLWKTQWRRLRSSWSPSPSARAEAPTFARALLRVGPPMLSASFLVFGWTQRSWSFVIVAIVLAAISLRVWQR